ncbi:MAG: MotA/TolQ/ExbB proton channel family protein [Coriobacteriales bacterium]
MDFLQATYLSQMMHTISESLTVPVVVILMLLIVYSLYTIGSVIVEFWIERRSYAAMVPELVARLGEAKPEELEPIIENSGLLRSQVDDLKEMVSYLYLSEDARTEVAKRLLANEKQGYQKAVGRTDVAAKIAPMLGLMGTLIPLGPGIVALGAGDTQTLSQSLQFAFDTTVAGLATAVVCFAVTRVRRRWYSDYLVSMEAAFNTLLEKGTIMHEEGYDFDRSVWHYDKMGRRAVAAQLERAL